MNPDPRQDDPRRADDPEDDPEISETDEDLPEPDYDEESPGDSHPGKWGENDG